MLERIVKKRIGHMEAGQTIFHLLSTRFTYHSQEHWRQLFAENRIYINGQIAQVTDLLQRDDIIEYHPPEIEEPEIDPNYSVIFEDDALLIINKPANLPCHPSGKFFRNTLWGLLKQRIGDDYPIRIVHRLDRETSGIIVIAKTEHAAFHCQQQFSHRTTEKHYLAIVEGTHFPTDVLAQGFLSHDTESKIRKKRKFTFNCPTQTTECGKIETAETHFLLKETHSHFSLVEAIPHTGRLHQIRATLRALNFPIVGDKLYGIDEKLYLRFIQQQLTEEDQRRLRLPFQALHAHRLTLRHPETKEQLTFEAPMPQHFLHLLDRP